MKNILLILLTFSALGIRAQSYNFLGEYDWRGTPLYLEAELDNVSIETLEMISNSLPESYPVPDYNPQYITSGYDTDIKLNDDADVWITFISEGAGYRNVLGFYTYDLENPLTSNPTKEDITIIFPNASALGSGGGLKVGDKVKIGSFKAGTGIGWVLLANAWSERNQSVGNGLWQFITQWIFDVEIFKRITHYFGIERAREILCEKPLKRWIHADGSKLSMKDSVKIIGQLGQIAWSYRKLNTLSEINVFDKYVVIRDNKFPKRIIS